MDAGVAFASLSSVVDDDGADLGEPSLSAHRLSGHPILLRSKDECECAQRASRKSIRSFCETYEKLGIPLKERELLAGVAVDAVFDSVSVATTFREKLEQSGHLFLLILRGRPEVSRPGEEISGFGRADPATTSSRR